MLSDTRMEEQVLCSLAEDALTNGDVKVASDYFAQLTRDNPDNTLHHSRLAECHYRSSRWDDCLASTKVSQAEVDSQFLRCLALYKKGDPHSAWKVWSTLSKQSASSLYIREQVTLELPCLTNAVHSTPPCIPVEVKSSINLLKNAGNGKFKCSKYPEAITLYERGLAELDQSQEEFKILEANLGVDVLEEEFSKLRGVLLSNIINCQVKVGDMRGALLHAQECVAAQPGWAKSHFWLGVCCMYSNMYSESRAEFEQCKALDPSTEKQVREKLDYLTFFTHHSAKLQLVVHAQWCGIKDTVLGSTEWLSGKAFAKTVTQLYQDNDSGDYSMACGILVDKKGEITDVTAPKYGTGEKEKKLIEKMKSGERSKVFVHVTQCSSKQQRYGFSQTDNLSSDQRLKLDILTDELNKHDMFNVHLQEYLPSAPH